MVSAKGKEKVSDGGKGKRKLNADDDKTGRKRKNGGVLQFFDDAAYQVDDDDDFSDDDSMFDEDDYFEDEFGSEPNTNNDKVPHAPPFVPKEEEMSDEEFERMTMERYKPGAGYVTYAEDGYDQKRSIGRGMYVPSAKDPGIWKVKCVVGRERNSAFCLMQKYVDLERLGTKLQIISAFAPDHVKGYIVIEAEKQSDIYEACKGISTIYSTRVVPIPSNEMSRLLSARSKSSAISEGIWVRVKNGKYKGDLAQVVSVKEGRKKATVKLIPRIDLKAMAAKFGGGVKAKRTAIPAQRLICSSELEEFRPLIQFRRDRDTNLMVEVLDGMMLKDGYLYKRVSIDSLSIWGVVPTEDELLKFEPSQKDDSTDVQWLSQLFGEKKKKQVEPIKQDKGGGKGEGSSSASIECDFELYELVFFGRKDFGVVLGIEKDGVKIIKEGLEGPIVVTVKQSELRSASFDKKLFSVLDKHSKTISFNDSVRVLDGPLKDRQGIVKKIYKGVLFLFDENAAENDGYICIRAQLCEKVNISGDASNASETGPSGFADLPTSPQTPLESEKFVQERDGKSNFKHEDSGTVSIGQSLRIRVGPLKGYLCRVLAVRRSDITVKLDSQQKILTVKSEHLSEVRGRNPAISQGEESGTTKPFDFLGIQDGARDWLGGAAVSTEGDKPNGGIEDSWLQAKATTNENSSWGAAVAEQKTVQDSGSGGGWGTSSGWNQASSSTAVTGGPNSWGKPVEPQSDNSGEKLKDDSWGKAAAKSGDDTSGGNAAWGKSGASSEKQIGGWGNGGGDLNKPEASSWKKDNLPDNNAANESQWGNAKKDDAVGSWGKGGSSWGKGTESQLEENADGNKKDSWANASEKWKNDASSGQSGAWGNAGGLKSSDDIQNSQIKNWDNNKASEGASDGGSQWGKGGGGGSSWNKGDGGSSWNKGGNKDDTDQEGNWGRSKPLDEGHGFGGRRGGRGGGRGGRDQYGRGRSFGQGQSSSWNNEGQTDDGSSDVGKKISSWSCGSDQAGGWSKPMSDEGSKKDGGWGTSNVSADKDGGEKENKWGSSKSSGWGAAKEETGGGKDGWNVDKKPNEGNESSGWGKIDDGGSQKASEETSSCWNVNSSKDEGKKDNWGSQKGSEGASSGWNQKKDNVVGGASTGWGQGNWSKTETGGNVDSTWSSKSNWNSGNGGFGDNNNNQDDTSRGGNWRGGRGGRGDRGGFRGRGGSDRGGGFGGRGGGFGGRGGFDREGGFRGRGGGFRGRGGRGDWNRGGDSNEDKPYNNNSSWNGGGSNSDSWKSGGDDNNQRQLSWSQPKGDGSKDGGQTEGGWGSSKKEVSSGGWNSKPDGGSAGTWGKSAVAASSGQTEAGAASGWGSSKKEVSTGWNKPAVDKEGGGGWNSKPDSDVVGGSADTWGKAAASSWKKPEANDGEETKEPSDSWGKKPSTSSWGDGGSKGGW